MMRLYCVRGAVCCDNTKDSVLTNVGNLIRELLEKNAVTDAENIVSIQFTMTPDVNVLNPATAFRKASLCIDTSRVPLFCSAEPVVAGMLDHVIRVMITFYAEEHTKTQAVYLNGAEVLRPDLVSSLEKS